MIRRGGLPFSVAFSPLLYLGIARMLPYAVPSLIRGRRSDLVVCAMKRPGSWSAGRTGSPPGARKEDVMRGISPLVGLGVAPLPVPASWYAVPLRVIVGLGFIEHGIAKLARGADGFIAILHAIGVPFADFLGWATIGVEIAGGAMILLGAFVPVAPVPMIAVLLVATFTVHLPNGFSSIKLLSYDATGAHFGQPGYETDLLYMAGLVALCVGGAGPLSLDSRLTARRVDSTMKHRQFSQP
jgi:putative oxidoreductase